MVSSLAVLSGAPRSNGAMVAPQVTNLEPHEFIRGSSQWRVKANYKEKALYVADI